MRIQNVCILGGTGFVGRHLVSELTRRGYRSRVLTRRRERHRELLVFPRTEVVETDIHYVSDLSAAFAGCDAVVNLVGILNEGRAEDERFQVVHADLPAKVVEACRFNRIDRLLHMSALKASPRGPSRYLMTKAAGEEAAHAGTREGMKVTSFRPSVIFGTDDESFNRFAALLKLSPYFFPLACAQTRFAPVYVGDVVRAFADALEDKPSFGMRYALCGPRVYTLAELMAFTAKAAGLHRRVIGLGDTLSRTQARVFELVPGKPFSRDNYLSMQVDSVCDEEEQDGFEALGIVPQGIEAIVPGYVGPGGRTTLYDTLRISAGRR